MKLLSLPTKYGTRLWLSFWPRFDLSVIIDGRYWSVWWEDGKFRTYRFNNIWRKSGTPLPKR
jgi:hypothetical protein